MKKEYYRQFVTAIEKLCGYTTRYHIGDRFIIDVTKCEHELANPKALMNLWKKAGYIEEVHPTHIAVNTFFTDSEGTCRAIYNPFIKNSEDGKRRVINFEWMREYTEENVAELVAECIRMREMDIRVL